MRICGRHSWGRRDIRWELVGTRGGMVFPDWKTMVERCEPAERRGSKMFPLFNYWISGQ